ncbi:hypothetical protein Y032_0113g396 [Ancylostoma ceylanicum]|uniref:Uncharacterized protein n=1 Tax=Ancylostoma ceylanicum TaxID=53326 RepID=A0A016TDJ1_9BILA|nr:hypothetical protein Y032_0113g396 [Ancylostoma ceylanicum]
MYSGISFCPLLWPRKYERYSDLEKVIPPEPTGPVCTGKSGTTFEDCLLYISISILARQWPSCLACEISS